MNKKLKRLYGKYLTIESEIRNELNKLEADECNCNDQEEINLVTDESEDVGIDKRCGNCGGIIWNREL